MALIDGLHRDYHRLRYSAPFGEPRWFLDKTDVVAEPFRCRYVVFPVPGDGRARLLPMKSAHAALQLIRNSVYPILPSRRYDSTAEHLDELADFLRTVECFQLVGGDARQVVDMLLTQLRW